MIHEQLLHLLMQLNVYISPVLALDVTNMYTEARMRPNTLKKVHDLLAIFDSTSENWVWACKKDGDC
jgi:hypothetical protein